MAKKISEGPYEGLKVISANVIIAQQKEAKDTLEFPTVERLMGTRERKLTPNYCPNGDIERCPAPCGACMYVQNVIGVFGREQIYAPPVLDVEKYLAQNTGMVN